MLRPVERSWQLISAQDVRAVSLEIGPMALAGSTRMQATTVQTLFVGLALLSAAVDRTLDLCEQLERLRCFWRSDSAPVAELARLTEFEAALYTSGGLTTYVAPATLGLTVLTDTTERSPTFSLLPFENVHDSSHVDPRFCSLCYLSIAPPTSGSDSRKDSSTESECLKTRAVPEFNEAASERVWSSILGGRSPRTLEWDSSRHLTGRRRLLGFDISERSLVRRARHGAVTIKIRELVDQLQLLPRTPTTSSSSSAGFAIEYEYVDASGNRREQQLQLNTSGMHALTAEVALKLALNAHSTLVAGRIGRYESNVMTFVTPSNCKLIDRAVRYVQYLLHQREQHVHHFNVEQQQHRSQDLQALTSNVEVKTETASVATRSVEAPAGEQKLQIAYSYDEIALTLKEVADRIGPTESIVSNTYETLLTRLHSMTRDE